MAETEDLEPQQYERMYWEEDVPVKDVRKNALRQLVYIGGLLCAVFLVIGMFVKFPDQVELPFIIKSDQTEEVYRFPYPVYVLEKYVKPGETVRREQRLARITSPEIAALVSSYLEAEQNLLNFSNQKLLSILKQKELITTEIMQNENKIRETRYEMSVLENTWESNRERLQFEYDEAFEKYEANKKLYNDRVIARFTFLEFEKKKIVASDSLTSQEQKYKKVKFNLNSLLNQYLLEDSSLQVELSKLAIDSKYDSVSLSNQLELAENKIRNTFGDFELQAGDLALKAGRDGTVSFLFEGEKEVAAGSILLKVIGSSPAMYAWVKSPPSLIGKIAKNEQVVLKVASFPFYEWGAARGHVDNLSLTPDENGHFFVKVAIDDFGKLNNLVQLGMNGDATVIMQERTFYEYFFRKVKKAYFRTMAY